MMLRRRGLAACVALLARRGAASYLAPRHVPFVRAAAAAMSTMPARVSAHNGFSYRSPPPIAFEGGRGEPSSSGLPSLSIDEIKQLLNQRGVVYEEDATMADLSSLLRLRGDDLDALPSDPPPSRTLFPREMDRVEVFERVSPAVAFIRTSIVRPRSQFSLRQQNSYPLGAGSGFLWDEHGHVITNYHVVNGGPAGRPGGELPRKVMVKLAGSEEQVEAKVVGWEADKDLCVLKIDPAVLPLSPIEVGTSSDLRVGQSVLAIGNPFGLDFTLTTGIVSALGRDVDGAGGRPIKDCIQTDAAINPGNSGGPLLDSHGRLIGMNTMIYAPGGIGANVGIGFAIPVDTVTRYVNQIIKYGPNARPSLGVSVLPDGIRKQYAHNLRRPLVGAVVAEVVPGSPADALKLAPCERQRAGVLLGDMITAVNGNSITTNEDLLCAVEESDPDQPIRITVQRNCDPSREEELECMPVPRKSLVGRQE